MQDTPSGRCHKRPQAQHGDVDINGDLVDRLRGATVTCAGIDREAHVLAVASEILRVKRARAQAVRS